MHPLLEKFSLFPSEWITPFFRYQITRCPWQQSKYTFAVLLSFINQHIITIEILYFLSLLFLQ